jgi:hypothetical protein
MAIDNDKLALLATPEGKLALVRELHKSLHDHLDRLAALRKAEGGTVPGPHVTGGEAPPTMAGSAPKPGIDWHGLARDAQMLEHFIHNPMGTIRSYVNQQAAIEQANNAKAAQGMGKGELEPKSDKETVPKAKVVPAEGSGGLAKAGMPTNKPPAISAPTVPAAKPPSGGTTASAPTGISPAKQSLGMAKPKTIGTGILGKSERCAFCGKPEHTGECETGI